MVNPIKVDNVLFNCTSVGQASDLIKASDELKLSIKLVVARYSVFGRVHRGSTVGFLLLQRFSVGLPVEYSSCFISVFNLDLYVCCVDALMS